MKFQRGSAIHPGLHISDEDIVCSMWKHIAKRTKNRTYGDTPFIYCNFDPVNRRIYEKDVGDRKVYGWDHTGIEIPEDQACTLPEFQVQEGQTEQMPF